MWSKSCYSLRQIRSLSPLEEHKVDLVQLRCYKDEHGMLPVDSDLLNTSRKFNIFIRLEDTAILTFVRRQSFLEHLEKHSSVTLYRQLKIVPEFVTIQLLRCTKLMLHRSIWLVQWCYASKFIFQTWISIRVKLSWL